MVDPKHISTEWVGGDVDWWNYGGLFVHTFKQNGHQYRELWKTVGLDETYETEVDEDDPELRVTVYTVSLPDSPDPTKALLDLANIRPQDIEFYLELVDEKYQALGFKFFNETHRHLIAHINGDTGWVDWQSIMKQYEPVEDFYQFPDQALVASAGDYHGWLNLDTDGDSDTWTRKEIRKVLRLKKD